MGKSVTPKYRAQYYDQSGKHMIDWCCKRNGRPTEANAEKLRQSLNKSFGPDGVNYHVSKAAGYIIHVHKVDIERNTLYGEIVATAKAPLFEVL